MWRAWVRGEVFTGFWLGGPKARDHWEDLGFLLLDQGHNSSLHYPTFLNTKLVSSNEVTR
jgi:hypothetical protein